MTCFRSIASVLFVGSVLAACGSSTPEDDAATFSSYDFTANVTAGTSKGTQLAGTLVLTPGTDDTHGGGSLYIPPMGTAAAQTIGVGAVISQSSVALTFTMDGGKVISGTGMFTGSLLAGPDHGEGTLTGPTTNDTGDWAFTVTKACTASVKKTCRAQSASCLSAKQYDATCVTKTLTSLNAIGSIAGTHSTDFTPLAQKNCCDQLVFNTVAGCGCRFGSAL